MLPLLSRPLVRLFIGERVFAAECHGRWGKTDLRDFRSFDQLVNEENIEVAIGSVLSGRDVSRDVDIILGQPHVFYLALPWEPDHCRPDVLLDRAKQRLLSTFGERTGRLTISVNKPEFGRPSIAAAASFHILDVAKKVVKDNGFRLRAMQPLASYIWNILKNEMVGETGSLEIIEDDFLTCARYQKGCVVDISVSPLAIAQKYRDMNAPSHSPSCYGAGTGSIIKRNASGDVSTLISQNNSQGIGGFISFILARGE